MEYRPVNNADSVEVHVSENDPATRWDRKATSSTMSYDSRVNRDGKPSVAGWPDRAEHARKITVLRVLLFLFDLILASTPIMFVVLAIITAQQEGKFTSEYGEKLSDVLLLVPTIFPVIFAALMGRFFRHLGIYLAGRGTTLGRLEQLIGCQSVFSAVERQLCLRSWSFVGILSIIIWLLSPIGGQSAVRMLGTEIVSNESSVRHLGPLSIGETYLSGTGPYSGGRKTVSSLFTTALTSSSKYQAGPTDPWGNPKLPIYRFIENSTSDEWKVVGNSSAETVTYASLIGIPILDLPTHGTTNFSIKVRQFDVLCSSNEFKVNNASDPMDFSDRNVTWKLVPETPDPRMCRNATIDCHAPQYAPWPIPIISKSLSYAENFRTLDHSVAKCNVSMEYLEAAIRCEGTACAVYKMRKLDLLADGDPRGLDAGTRRMFMPMIMTSLPDLGYSVLDSRTGKGSTEVERWMMDPQSFLNPSFDRPDLWRLTPEVFSQRFTQIWNSFWQSTYGTRAVLGVLPQDVLPTGELGPVGGTIQGAIFNTTRATKRDPFYTVYKIDRRWLGALLTCSLVLLIAAYAGLILKYLSLTPDIIGYASSLTLMNPYAPTPTGGTTLHGLERAALLSDMPVRIGDVCPNDEVGAIMFARVQDGNVVGLNRKRLYI